LGWDKRAAMSLAVSCSSFVQCFEPGWSRARKGFAGFQDDFKIWAAVSRLSGIASIGCGRFESCVFVGASGALEMGSMIRRGAS
jgi:hypothetical protein